MEQNILHEGILTVKFRTRKYRGTFYRKFGLFDYICIEKQNRK